jgi:hypothetical protein
MGRNGRRDDVTGRRLESLNGIDDHGEGYVGVVGRVVGVGIGEIGEEQCKDERQLIKRRCRQLRDAFPARHLSQSSIDRGWNPVRHCEASRAPPPARGLLIGEWRGPGATDPVGAEGCDRTPNEPSSGLASPGVHAVQYGNTQHMDGHCEHASSDHVLFASLE